MNIKYKKKLNSFITKVLDYSFAGVTPGLFIFSCIHHKIIGKFTSFNQAGLKALPTESKQ